MTTSPVGDAISRSLLALAKGQTVELRAIGTKGAKSAIVTVDDSKLADAAKFVESQEAAGSRGVYWTPNPIKGRGKGKGGAATDADVLRRHWLLIDVDPVRPADTSATTAEREAAWKVSHDVRSTLEASGFGGLVVCDSGNGWHVMVPVDLPNDEASRDAHKELLRQLQKRFGTDGAHVDVHTFNAARIWKLPGTMARKGESSAERAHRRARIVAGPWNGHGDVNWPDFREDNNQALTRLLTAWGRQAAASCFVDDAYARASLEGEVSAVAATAQGGRNVRLNQAAFRLGRFAAAGRLTGSEITAALGQAAIAAGLDAAEAAPVIQRGLKSGMAAGPETNGMPDSAGSAAPAAASAVATVQPSAWGIPTPLNTLPDAPPFPVDVLPGPIAEVVAELTSAMNCPPDFPGACVLALAGAAFGNSRAVMIKIGHVQPAILYIGYAARPGATKTAPLNFLRKPLDEAQADWFDEWTRAMEIWRAADADTKGPRPIHRRCLIQDTTAESAVIKLEENYRGLVTLMPELSALVDGLNQYKAGGKGTDRQHWCTVWDGGTMIVDRASHKDREGAPLVARDTFLSVIGPLPVDKLADICGRQAADDGLADRFLFSYPRELPMDEERWVEASEKSKRVWGDTVQRLLSLPVGRDSKDRPVRGIIPLTTKARGVWQAFTREMAAEVNSEGFPDPFRGPWSKLVAYCARLGLVIQMLRWATGEAGDDAVDDKSLTAGVQLVRYFKGHCRRVRSFLFVGAETGSARKVLAWIERKRVTSFKAWEAQKDLESDQLATVSDLDKPLNLLVDYGYLRVAPAEQRSGPGRKAAAVYEVNPHLPNTTQGRSRESRESSN